MTCKKLHNSITKAVTQSYTFLDKRLRDNSKMSCHRKTKNLAVTRVAQFDDKIFHLTTVIKLDLLIHLEGTVMLMSHANVWCHAIAVRKHINVMLQ